MENKNNLVKDKQVKQLVQEMKKAKTIMIVSIKGLPSKQFQSVKKSIREDASVKVAKKNILNRAIKNYGKESILPFDKYVNENCAFVISNLDGYELAGMLTRKRNPISAKAGQIAPMDIEVKEGPTELAAGPAISELGALGIQIAVENGKISIKKSKIVVKNGEEIRENVAAVLQKLHIQPFSVGLEPVAIYDIGSEKIFSDIKINSEETVNELKYAAAKSLGFAQKIGYYCRETIGYFLAKANAEGESLNRLNKETKE